MVLLKSKFVFLCTILRNKRRDIASLLGVYFKMLYMMSLKVIGIGNMFNMYADKERNNSTYTIIVSFRSNLCLLFLI